MRTVSSQRKIKFWDSVRGAFNDAIALLFPELCVCCERALVSQEKHLCTPCLYHLPVTGFHHDADNLAMRQLAGRIPLNALASYLYFSAGSSVQRIVHRIKYQKGFVLADYLGFLYGLELGKSAAFRSCDLIVPVPLHKKRLRWRGYNQSEWFARGLGRALSVEVISDSLVRTVHTRSQTKSNTRWERFENMEGIFQVVHPARLEGKHILLVDDVLTTGATLEACCIPLLQISGVRLSIATIAVTKH